MADTKTLSVDKEKCIGCRACEGIAEDFFKIGEDDKSEVLQKKITKEDEKIVEEAISACPADAITLI